MSETIQSEANARFKRCKKLVDNARHIKKEGVTLAEGAHLAQTILERGIVPEAMIVRAAGLNAEASELFDKFSAKRVPYFVLDSRLYDVLSPVEHGCGLMLEVKVPSATLPQALPVDVLYLDGVQDPGNIGTMIRTAVAAGVKHIAGSAACANFWSPKALRAGMGAHFAATLYENVPANLLSEAFAAKRFAADARGGQDLYRDTQWHITPCVWMMGSEGQGLGEVALSVADARYYIPITEGCESLNVGAAAAVCLFEQRRRRLTATC